MLPNLKFQDRSCTRIQYFMKVVCNSVDAGVLFAWELKVKINYRMDNNELFVPQLR